MRAAQTDAEEKNMQTKVQAYVQLADETSLKITGNYLDWLSFLTTASRLYKYPYHDQLMIYAQRPDVKVVRTVSPDKQPYNKTA